ncbi:MAG: exodeoxyribonuclease VII small subunit [Pirellulaceae bacterium]|nr:exodeoxyribonuclease VII small subunit [Pirellulaceae bacterium]
MSNRPDPPSDTSSFEAALASLEAIVHDLEDGDLGLAEALSRYEQGIKHLRHCYDLLEQAERKIELLTGIDAEGRAKTVPFADDEAPIEEPPEKEPALKPHPRRKPRRTLLDLEDEEEM